MSSNEVPYSNIQEAPKIKNLTQRVSDNKECAQLSHEIIQKMCDADSSIFDFSMNKIKKNAYVLPDKMLLATNMREAQENLKNLSRIMKFDDHLNQQYNANILTVVDPTLDYRFLSRKSIRDLNIPQIKTRIKWQNGEFPFFKVDTRHYTKENISYKNTRNLNRYIKSFVIQDTLTGEYLSLDKPTHILPLKGELLITNQRLFFRKGRKKTLDMPFENILNYSYYDNGLQVEFMQFNQKLTEVFFVDSDKARLLEAMVKITL